MNIVLYQAVNKINGNRYVGITAKGLCERRREHWHGAKRGDGYRFAQALRKHGINSFDFRILVVCSSYEYAQSTEIKAISVFKPEYNITSGGGGTLGTKRSSEARAKMRAARLANPNRYWLGKKRSPETIAKIKATKLLAPKRPMNEKERVARVANFAKIDREKKKRAVLCVEDGLQFDSITSAAAHYGAPKTNISALLHGRPRVKTVSGRTFKFLTGGAGGPNYSNQ